MIFSPAYSLVGTVLKPFQKDAESILPQHYSKGANSDAILSGLIDNVPNILPYHILHLNPSYNLQPLSRRALTVPPCKPKDEDANIIIEDEYYYAIIQGRRVGVFYMHQFVHFLSNHDLIY